jgi:ribosomal protein S26
MKNLIKYGFIAVVSCFYSCVNTDKPIEKKYINKIVVAKNIEQQLPSKWQDSNTYYLIAFDDGDYISVDYGTYAITKISDTLEVCVNCN